jgi:hypothetical protein
MQSIIQYEGKDSLDNTFIQALHISYVPYMQILLK